MPEYNCVDNKYVYILTIVEFFVVYTVGLHDSGRLLTFINMP